MTQLNQWQKVLVSMFKLSKQTTNRFAYEELVLQAWKDFPDTFSLRNHPEHPDASDIHKRIYSTLIKQGLAVSVGNKTFRLTEEGLRQAAVLGGEAAPSGSQGRLARDQKLYLQFAKNSSTFREWAINGERRLIDDDARQFFQFSTHTSVPDRIRRYEFALLTFEASQSVEPDAESLLQLARYLRRTYSSMFEGTR